jgi:hypothetical protein
LQTNDVLSINIKAIDPKLVAIFWYYWAAHEKHWNH